MAIDTGTGSTGVSSNGSKGKKVSKKTSVLFSVHESTTSLFKDLSLNVDGNNNNNNNNKKNDEGNIFYYGPYAHIRKNMDYTYHKNYIKCRQWVQDSIIEKLLGEVVRGKTSTSTLLSSQEEQNLNNKTHTIIDDLEDDSLSNFDEERKLRTASAVALKMFYDNDNDNDTKEKKKKIKCPKNPWLIYVAGTKLSNRSFTIASLMGDNNNDHHHHQQNSDNSNIKFPILGFVLVDQREIRSLLPEYDLYLQKFGEEKANRLTEIETGYIEEVLIRAALELNNNVLLYGSLKSPVWAKQYCACLHRDFKFLKIAVLHICAPNESNEERCKSIVESIKDHFLPSSSIITYICTLQSANKSNDIKILSNGETWDSFTTMFTQSEYTYEPEPLSYHNHLVTTDNKRGGEGFIRRFCPLKSTEEIHSTSVMAFYGPYAHIRKCLDYEYHRNYTRDRQLLQDAIIKETVNTVAIVDYVTGKTCTTPTEPFLIFTAGAMGAGKGYTINKLKECGRFPLLAFAKIDPDEIRQQFPEYGMYVSCNPLVAGEMTRKEAGYIVEILTLAALEAGKNAMIDGSLRDHDWYGTHFDQLRSDYPSIKIAILHVDAPKEAVFARAEARGKKTGRVIPRKTLQQALEQVPKSVEILRHKVNEYYSIMNAPPGNNANTNDGLELTKPEGTTWETFTDTWNQRCAWIPKKRSLNKKLRTSTLHII